ncbi:phage terminase large subunit, partial [Flexivirga sp.]|uniref:phage terminase large subunit n=1 Tax=Flexivirga sp. TaxID=1962927 RepID=UPI003F7FB3FF
GARRYLLYRVHDRLDFIGTLAALRQVIAKFPGRAVLVEDKANGPAILNALRAKVGGLIPVEPEGSKYARAAAITPLVEGKDVVLPDPVAVDGTAWVTDLTEEARDFPGAAHDDTVDGMSQAVHRLLLVPILDGGTHDADELLDDEDIDLGWATAI